jgi:5-methylcytosine-specific restriction endonuclease McrA
MNTCEFCNKIINNKGSLVAHIKCCKNNPNKVQHKRSKHAGQKKGSIPWNKNKTFKEISEQKLFSKIETGEYTNFSQYTIRRLARLYLISKHGHSCMICGLTEWRGVQIPLVADHIDGNSENNNLDNFRIICNNCDAILLTFKGKNRGKGRKSRYK